MKLTISDHATGQLKADAGSLYTPTKPIANPIKWTTNTLNTLPRYIINEDVWKNLGKPYRKKREELKENINAQGNKIIQKLTPPIPYVDYQRFIENHCLWDKNTQI